MITKYSSCYRLTLYLLSSNLSSYRLLFDDDKIRSESVGLRCLVAGIASSNPTEGMDVCLVSDVCCADSSLCNELITRSEECYRMCVSNCV